MTAPKRAKKKERPYSAVQVIDGTWYAVGVGETPFIEECCGCGLVHRHNYKFEKGRLWIQYIVDDALTKAARKLRAKKKN